jgi:hypothetical protein
LDDLLIAEIFGIKVFLLKKITEHLSKFMGIKCFWVVTADMGFGHRRAVHPFAGIACRRILLVNSDDIAPQKEQKYWRLLLYYYESISRAKRIPVAGALLFGFLNYLLKIPPANASANLKKPTFQVKILKHQIRKGLCRGLTEHLKKYPGGLLTSFYATAIAADMAGVKEIYCIICDSDLNRVWVAEDPGQSNIAYFSPCAEASERLEKYGVSKEKIYTTGFPLHPDLIGSRKLELAESSFNARIEKLEGFNNNPNFEHLTGQPINLTFAIGGAGAQTEIAVKIFDSFEQYINTGQIRFTIIAGVRKEVKRFFLEKKKMSMCKNFRLLWYEDHDTYFGAFNKVIRTTDILISKPGEISFFAGLGIPFIITPPIGSQEEFNRRWLLKIGAGIDLPGEINLCNWFGGNLSNGLFVRLATAGYKNIEKAGYYHIMDLMPEKIN